ncbi:PLP-dependent aminotransferase family protein [Halalkalibacter urbisdiaboli]|uniref:MocR-like pyridoxine biosynthesis transcription factor PdxR n=1 Tax=Halalkalibacter urbisdiaboli TaxID=1960589 RepID=UPI000B42E5AF|nr:PLP-dependent aminotransferase family protein [Halalkalibacter urbisdiaboli]
MLWVPIDRNREIPFIRQVYLQIRNQILKGHLVGGQRLPSTRQLATELQVSRNVIMEAYEQLLAEGFIETRQGAGTYVAKGAFLEEDRGDVQRTNILLRSTHSQKVIDFRSGIPDLGYFPRVIWAKLAADIYRSSTDSMLSYGEPEGRYELRQAISKYLGRTRGVHCHPEQIVVTSGATQALTMITKLLLSKGDTVLIEDPITDDIQTIFTQTGANLHPITVDRYGMNTDALSSGLNPKFVFVTPSHQFPLGSTLPIQRRIQLIQFARENGCYLVEDDYDSEFRYAGLPVSSLQGLAPELVIYVGSFSKILSPGLRLGYVILPSHLIEQGRQVKWFSDLHTPSVEQVVLARFIEAGYLERHILKMKKIYKKRRDFLIQLLTQYFSDQINILGDSTGLHIIVEFKELMFTSEFFNKMVNNGVRVYPVERHAIVKGKHKNKVIVGYGHLGEDELQEGIAKLSRFIQQVRC